MNRDVFNNGEYILTRKEEDELRRGFLRLETSAPKKAPEGIFPPMYGSSRQTFENLSFTV